MGLDVDLASYIAGAMGVELSLVIKPFAQLLPALEAGEVDMVISGMTITPERNLQAAFVGLLTGTIEADGLNRLILAAGLDRRQGVRHAHGHIVVAVKADLRCRLQALAQQLEQPQTHELAFEQRLALLIEREQLSRENRRLKRLLSAAKLRVSACIEDIDYAHQRGLKREQMAALASGEWIGCMGLSEPDAGSRAKRETGRRTIAEFAAQREP